MRLCSNSELCARECQYSYRAAYTVETVIIGPHSKTLGFPPLQTTGSKRSGKKKLTFSLLLGQIKRKCGDLTRTGKSKALAQDPTIPAPTVQYRAPIPVADKKSPKAGVSKILILYIAKKSEPIRARYKLTPCFPILSCLLRVPYPECTDSHGYQCWCLWLSTGLRRAQYYSKIKKEKKKEGRIYHRARAGRGRRMISKLCRITSLHI